MNAKEDWAEPTVRLFADRWHALHNEHLGADKRELLVHWLRDRIGGPEPDYYLVFDWNDEPCAVLLNEDTVRLVTLEGDQLVTKYLPALEGGSYTERWIYADDRFTLVLTFEHELLPGVIQSEFRTLREIDQEAVGPLRDLLRGWAEADVTHAVTTSP